MRIFREGGGGDLESLIESVPSDRPDEFSSSLPPSSPHLFSPPPLDVLAGGGSVHLHTSGDESLQSRHEHTSYTQTERERQIKRDRQIDEREKDTREERREKRKRKEEEISVESTHRISHSISFTHIFYT